MIDFHIHTSLCNHAEDSMEGYVMEALKKGLKEICFLEHFTLETHSRNVYLHEKELMNYLQAIHILKQKYRDQIIIKTGLEVDFSPDYAEKTAAILGRYDFDAIGSSIHYLSGVNIASRSSAETLRNMKQSELEDLYIKAMYTMLEYDYFDFICHLDVLKKFGTRRSGSWLEKITHLLRKIKEKDKTIELNTGGISHPIGEHYPSLSILNICCDLNIPIITGSDAHRHKDTGRDIINAEQILKKTGYKEIVTFHKRIREIINL